MSDELETTTTEPTALAEQAVKAWEAAEAAAAEETPTEAVEAAAEEPQQEQEAEAKAEESKPDKSEVRQRALVDQLAKLERTFRATSQRNTELETRLQEATEVINLARTDPVKFFERSGVDVSGFAKGMMQAGEKGDPTQIALARMQAQLDKLTQSGEARHTEYQQQRMQEAQERERTRLYSYVETNAESYPYLAAYDKEHVKAAMYRVLDQHYRETRTLLDPSVAARQLNDELKSSYDRLHRVASKMGAAVKDATQTKPAPTSKTIGKAHSSATNKDPGEMSEQEKLRHAASLVSDNMFSD